RSISLLTFTVKLSAGRSRVVLGCFLCEPGLAQAAIAFEDAAALAADRLRAESGEFVAAVGLAESAAGDPNPAQAVKTLEQTALVGNGTDNQVRMRQVGGKKRLCNLDGCVAGLDDLLRKGKIVPHEEVHIRREVLR